MNTIFLTYLKAWQWHKKKVIDIHSSVCLQKPKTGLIMLFIDICIDTFKDNFVTLKCSFVFVWSWKVSFGTKLYREKKNQGPIP